jgi:hypothetical protein
VLRAHEGSSRGVGLRGQEKGQGMCPFDSQLLVERDLRRGSPAVARQSDIDLARAGYLLSTRLTCKSDRGHGWPHQGGSDLSRCTHLAIDVSRGKARNISGD